MLTCPSLNSQCQIHQWTLRLLNGGWLASFEEMGREIQIQWLNVWLVRSDTPCWGPCSWCLKQLGGFASSGQTCCLHAGASPSHGMERLFVREIYSFQSAIYMLFQGLLGLLKNPQTPVFASKGWRNEGLEDHCFSSAAVSYHSGVWGRKQAIQSALSSHCVMIATVWDQRFLFVGLFFF